MNNRNKHIIIIIIAIWFVKLNVFEAISQDKIIYNDNSVTLPISSQLYIFQDTKANFTVQDIINSDSEIFKKTLQQIPSFSFTSSSIWCKFFIKNTSNVDLYLEVSPPILNQVCIYQIKNGDIIDSLCSGSLYAKTGNNFLKSNKYIFKLDSKAEYYLLKVKSKTRLFIKAHIGSYTSLIKRNSIVDTIQSIYAGLILMIFIYHLFLLYTTREKVYLFYLLHLVNSAIYFLYMSGFGINYIWFNFPILNSYFIAIMSFGFIFSYLFVVNFLDSRKTLPIVHYFLIGVIFALVLNGITDLTGYSNISGRMLNYIGLVAITVVIIAALILIKRGFKPAYVFLSAWLFYMTGIAIQTLQSLNYISTNEFTSNAIQIGSGFEIILLSIAIGNKINFYKEGKLLARLGEKKLLLEKEGLKNSQNEKLEEQFQVQTEELYARNKELKRQTQEINKKFEEISLQNQKINEFHELLETKNKIITQQNNELKIHKDNLEQLIEERTWELQEATKQAEESDQLKTAFLKDFSHELRTPMNAIAGFSSLLLDVDVEDKSFDYYTGIIVNNTDNLLELIDNIIDLSRLQSNELSLKKVRFDPLKIFYSLKDKFQEKLLKDKKSFIDLILDVPKDKSLRVLLDYNRFYKIIFQLLDNSVKYTENGFIKFGYKKNEENNTIEVFIIDTGIGIKKEKLDIVFESFRKVEKSKLKFHPGTGLGLSLVKGLVKLMDGELIIDTVSAEDAPDKTTGTSIQVVIPNAFDTDNQN